MPPIHIMIKPASGRCNLRCDYCFYEDEASCRATHSYGMMDNETMHALIKKAFIYADDMICFTFQGGEPLLCGVDFYRSFTKCVDDYNLRGLDISYSLQTNATLLTDELCELFAKKHFLVGVSLDGPRDIHDAHRKRADGMGSYDMVKAGIALLQKHGVDFNILCVLTRDSVDKIDEIWKEISPYRYIQFIPCLDPLSGEEMEYSLDARGLGDALCRIFELYKSAVLRKAPVSERRMDNYMSMLLGYPPEHCGMSGACGMFFVAEADGSIYPCDFYALDEWRIGDVKSTSFSRMAGSEVMRKFLDSGSALSEKCKGCRHVYICRGGCRREREGDGVMNKYCEGYRHFFDSCLDDMIELIKKRA